MEPYQNVFANHHTQLNVKLLLAESRGVGLKGSEKKSSTRVADWSWSAEESTAYEDLKPILWMLRLSGRLPYSVDSKGNLFFYYGSPWMVYSLVLYLVSLGFVFINLKYIVDSLIASNFAIDELMFYMVSVVNLSQSISCPLGLSVETISFCDFINSWTLLKADLSKVTGRRPYDPYRRYWRLSSILSVPYGLVLALVETLYLGKGSWQYWVPSFVQIYSTCMMFTHLDTSFMNIFYTSSLCVSHCIASLTPLIESSGDKVASRLAQVRQVWMRLSNQIQNLLNVNKLTNFTLFLTCFITFLVSCYMIDTLIARWVWNARTGYFMFAGPYIGLGFFIMCNNSHNIQKSAGELQRTLLSLDTTKMSTATSREVFMFMEAISKNPPVISLDDFMVLNKSTFVLLISMTITYLIVLVQFRQQSF